MSPSRRSLTILATILFMYFADILMERISLGAFIIALCMLTDNAIVVTESIKVRVEKGEDKMLVIRESVAQNQWPLLGATAIAVIAFAAIGLSEDATIVVGPFKTLATLKHEQNVVDEATVKPEAEKAKTAAGDGAKERPQG